MMMNLFSIFDPSTNTFLSLNWLSCLIIMIIFPYQFWLLPSRYFQFFITLLNMIFNEFKILLKYSFSNLIIFMSFFMFILMNNFLGLFPYIFTASSHMSFTLSLALTLWLAIIIFSWLNFFNDVMSHLMPMGTPTILMPFMVIIEMISLIIRPITLSIRLSANMIAGHLLLSLLGSSGESLSNIFMFPILMTCQILLMFLEMAVSLIQAYVFSILSTLYSSEI